METEEEANEWGTSIFSWFPSPDELDIYELQNFGMILDRRPESLRGETVGTALAAQMLRVRDRDGRSRPLLANAVQSAFERTRGRRNIVLKARQVGLTTWTAARFLLKTITQPGTLTLQVAQTKDAAEEIFRIVHRFVDSMPEAVRNGPLRTSRASARAIAFPELDSQYLVVSAGEKNAGRGLTVQNLHCSEVARWPGNPGETLKGLLAALAPEGELILESTPLGVGGCFYEEWQRADETGMVRHFFPWWMEPRYREAAVEEASLSAEEQELKVRHGLDLRQIAYRRRLRRDHLALARQEYAEDSESCFLASGESVFELTAVEERVKTAPPPVQTRHNGRLEIWLPPAKDNHYVVAVDPAEGGSEGDYSVAQVVDLETGLQCAEFAAHMGGMELARMVTGLAEEYNGAMLAIERNGCGSALLARVQDMCRYPRIYEKNKKPGWLTDPYERPRMVGRLDSALVEHPEFFRSKKLLAECRTFVRLRDSSTGALPGTHDDRVMAMAIAIAVRDELLPLLEKKKRVW